LVKCAAARQGSVCGNQSGIMNAATTRCDEESANTSTQAPRFEVALVYQDLPTGLRARQFLNHVVDHCQLAAEFSLTLWKLEMFHLPEICEQAAAAASAAALVVLSLRGDIGLESDTENWLMQWISHRQDEECALAVLIDCDMQRLDSVGQTLFRLQDMTRASQVRLFVGFMPATPAAPISSAHPESDHTETILAVRGEI